MSAARVRRGLALLLATAALALTSCASHADLVAQARGTNDAFLAESGAQVRRDHAERFVAIQNGVVAATGATAAEAAERAADVDPDAAHRYVYRPDAADWTGPLGGAAVYIAYVPEGGTVAGDALQPLFGAATDSAELHLTALDGRARVVVSAALDRRFEGTLLVSVATAERLRLERFELPGHVDVEVPLGRPFRARRAMVRVRTAGDAPRQDRVVEALYEARRDRR